MIVIVLFEGIGGKYRINYEFILLPEYYYGNSMTSTDNHDH